MGKTIFINTDNIELQPSITDEYGNVFKIKLELDLENTAKNLREFIVEESRVTEFSEYWKYYYDWDCAGKETMDAYLYDINNHKNKVRGFLNNFKDDALIGIRKRLLQENKHDIANSILKELGYTYKE